MKWKMSEVEAKLEKCEDNSIVVEVPEQYEGRMVTSVGRSAFSERRALEQVRLPRGLREIDNNAFYNCRSLRSVELWDSLRSVGDGAFRNCEQLEEILLHVAENRVSCVRDILESCQREMTLRMFTDREEIALFFPEYELEYTAEGFTLSVHFTTIEHGSGYAYRRCMQGTGIDYRYYDSLFERSAREDRGPAVAAIAMMRLRYPKDLSSASAEMYRSWLKEHAADAVRRMMETGEDRWLSFLKEQGIFCAENLPECIRVAGEEGDPLLTTGLLTMSMELSAASAGFGAGGKGRYDL